MKKVLSILYCFIFYLVLLFSIFGLVCFATDYAKLTIKGSVFKELAIPIAIVIGSLVCTIAEYKKRYKSDTDKTHCFNEDEKEL